MKKNFRKNLSVMLSVLMLLSCFAFAMPASAAETCENCTWDKTISLRPQIQADGTWGNGYVNMVCTVCGAKRSGHIARANYTAYDAVIAELNALLAEPALSDVARAEINAVLAEKGVADNLIADEQNLVDAAVEAITEAVGKYMEEFTVTFVDADGKVLDTQEVTFGFDAAAPEVAFKEGFVFTGWDKDYTNITADLTITAQYYEGRAYIETDVAQLDLKPGASKTVSAVVYTDEAVDKTVTWTSADTSVVTVESNGLVTAVGIGYTTLTVSALEGAVEKKIDVYVYDGNGEHLVTLINGGLGTFVINGNNVNAMYIKMKSGQSFRFQFALSSKYDPENVVVTANGKTVELGEDNYFVVPYICEDTTITVSLAGSSDTGEAEPEDKPEVIDPSTINDTCWCHSSNSMFKSLWNVLMFFCKLLGLEGYHYCVCGAAHW